MATWRLTGKHYINVIDPNDPVIWIYEETDRNTGRRLRKQFKVPLYLDPAEPSFYHVAGEIYVAKEGRIKPLKGALVFEGDPTPDMEPMDDEAEEISNALKSTWVGPMSEGAFPAQGNTYGDKLLEQLTAQLSAVIAQSPIPKGTPLVPASAVTPEQWAEVQAQLKAVMEKNAELEARLNSASPPPTKPVAEGQGRRV